MRDWYWKNNYLFALLVIETCICLPFPRRKNVLIKWLAFLPAFLLISSCSMQNWVWDGNTIVAENIMSNVFWRNILALASVCQIYVSYELEWENALYLMVISNMCQKMQFGAYKIVESVILGSVFCNEPASPSVGVCLATLAVSCLAFIAVFHKQEILSFKKGVKSTTVVWGALLLSAVTDVYNTYLFVNDPNANIGVTMVVIRLYGIIFDITMIYMLYNLTVRRTLEMEKIAIATMSKQHMKQYESSRELMQMISVKSHDLKKQLRYLKQNPTGKKELVEEIESITESFDCMIQTENIALSTILSEKAAACAHEHIPFTVVCNNLNIDFMRDLDVYTLFANLLDNAIEATRAIPQQKRSISVIIKSSCGFLSIHQENTFSGNINISGENLLTTKKDKISHGYGYHSMRQLVEQYDGIISYQSNREVFSINILIPLKDTTEPSAMSFEKST